MMLKHVDLLVVGAGPSGLAAACAARDCGLEVALLDEQGSPGGQLLRNIESPLGQASLDPQECARGLELVEQFRQSGAMYFPETVVWSLERGAVSCTRGGKAHFITASSIIIAPGAMERPVPFPGWTLPGVMGAGAADILLRSGGSFSESADAPVVLAGNGPLLLLLAGHLLTAGVKISAWLDTGSWPGRIASGALMPMSVFDYPYIAKGIGMAANIFKAKIPIIRGVKNIRAVGSGRLQRVLYEASGKQHEINAEILLRHEGIIPRTHMLNSINAVHRWDSVQRYWYPDANEFGETSVDGIYVAGDACYVHGGDASLLKGTLSGIAAARRIGVISEGEAAYRSKGTLRKLRILRAARGFLRHLFAPNPSIYNVPDETVVCRCECVTAGHIRRVAGEGCRNVNEVKLYTRCGMGQCQGRMCGPALAELVAAVHSVSPREVGDLQARQPLRPVSLENYCKLHAPASEQGK